MSAEDRGVKGLQLSSAQGSTKIWQRNRGEERSVRGYNDTRCESADTGQGWVSVSFLSPHTSLTITIRCQGEGVRGVGGVVKTS